MQRYATRAWRESRAANVQAAVEHVAVGRPESAVAAEQEVAGLTGANEAGEIGVREHGLATGEAAHRGDGLALDHICRGLLLAGDDQGEAARRAVAFHVAERRGDVGRAAGRKAAAHREPAPRRWAGEGTGRR